MRVKHLWVIINSYTHLKSCVRSHSICYGVHYICIFCLFYFYWNINYKRKTNKQTKKDRTNTNNTNTQHKNNTPEVTDIKKKEMNIIYLLSKSLHHQSRLDRTFPFYLQRSGFYFIVLALYLEQSKHFLT